MDLQDRIFEMQSEICKVLANPNRLRILYLLEGRQMAAGQLAEQLGISMANLSQHLSIMRQKGLVTSRRAGLNVVYALSHPRIMEACRTLREVLYDILQLRSEVLPHVQTEEGESS